MHLQEGGEQMQDHFYVQLGNESKLRMIFMISVRIRIGFTPAECMRQRLYYPIYYTILLFLLPVFITHFS